MPLNHAHSAIEKTEKMHLHPVTLAFRDEHSSLESPFLKDYFSRSLAIFRFSCVFATLLYAAFGLLDAHLSPECTALFWMIRYAIFCPFAVGIFLLSFTPVFQKLMQPLISMLGLVGGAGIIVMIVSIPPSINFSYFAGLILVFMMGYTVVKLRFIWASITFWSLVLFYNIVAIFFADTAHTILINNNFFFIAANFIGMSASYIIEHYTRRDFFLKNLLEIEREKVNQSHDLLEQRVKERTSQLLQANEKIKHEMKERRQAEEERNRIQQQLIRHQKMESIGLMAGGVAHDLNNILSGIISYPEILLLELPPDSKLREPIEEILESGKRAAAVVADLLTVARGVACQKEIVSINTLIQTYLQSPEHKKLLSLYPRTHVHTRFEENLPNCLCSTVHIQKVLMNLVNNAFESITESGTITISTGALQVNSHGTTEKMLKKGNYVTFQVADDGSGIPADILQHIFEPFYTKKVMGRSGTGLGLAVVWNTLQDHEGTVHVQSSDNGTTFTAYLPATSEEQQSEQELKAENLHGKGTILVIDDEKVQRDIGKRILTSLGYDVITKESGESAILYLNDHSVDLVILDMLMDPGMNGLQTYKNILKIHPEQKAVIVSGFSEDDAVKATLKLSHGKFIKKPYSLEQLGKVVKQELQRDSQQ